MPRTKSTSAAPASLPAAYTYTPGDHRRYVWNGGESAVVERIVITGDVIDFVPTGDLVPMDGVARTASAFMARVDTWRDT